MFAETQFLQTLLQNYCIYFKKIYFLKNFSLKKFIFLEDFFPHFMGYTKNNYNYKKNKKYNFLLYIKIKSLFLVNF